MRDKDETYRKFLGNKGNRKETNMMGLENYLQRRAPELNLKYIDLVEKMHEGHNFGEARVEEHMKDPERIAMLEKELAEQRQQ